MFSDIGDVSSIQRDGGPPTIVTAGAAPGESGVAVMQLRYQGGAYFHADLRQHFVSLCLCRTEHAPRSWQDAASTKLWKPAFAYFQPGST